MVLYVPAQPWLNKKDLSSYICTLTYMLTCSHKYIHTECTDDRYVLRYICTGIYAEVHNYLLMLYYFFQAKRSTWSNDWSNTGHWSEAASK